MPNRNPIHMSNGNRVPFPMTTIYGELARGTQDSGLLYTNPDPLDLANTISF